MCLPDICHGQGQCPEKSSHSSDSSPEEINQFWELNLNLMIHIIYILLIGSISYSKYMCNVLADEERTKAVVE